MFEDIQYLDEPRASWLPDGQEPEHYGDLDHIYTKDQNETFDFVYYWRKTIDDYCVEKNITTDILIMTEAYASLEDTMRYYRDPINANRRGAHMPFNFWLIFSFERNSNSYRIWDGINEFMSNMPSGETSKSLQS